MKTLSTDVQSMEAAKDHAFTPPPRAGITDRVGKLNDLLAKRTEKSALALGRLTGSVTLSPQKPEVGKPYYRTACKFDVLNLLVEDGASNLLHWWSRPPGVIPAVLPAQALNAGSCLTVRQPIPLRIHQIEMSTLF